MGLPLSALPVGSVVKGIKSGKFSLLDMRDEMRKNLIDSEGGVSRSEFYMRNLDTSEELRLCMTPEKVNVKTTANFRSYNVVEVGEIKIPKGEKLTEISWHGIIPAAQAMLYSFANRQTWERPNEILKVFKRWRENPAKIKLLITQTPINLEVYLKKFDFAAEGGLGDYKYSVDFIAAKPLKYLTIEEADAERKRKAEERDNGLQERMSNKSPVPAMLDSIDDIFALAMLFTGKGGLDGIDVLLDMAGASLGGVFSGGLASSPLKILPF